MYKGALVDIEKLLQQMDRSEKAREETELRLVDLTKVNNELQSSGSKSKDKIKDLQSELKSCNRKLGDAEASFFSANVRETTITHTKTILIIDFLLSLKIRKNIRIIIQFCLAFTTKSAQYLQKVIELHQRRNHHRKFTSVFHLFQEF